MNTNTIQPFEDNPYAREFLANCSTAQFQRIMEAIENDVLAFSEL